MAFIPVGASQTLNVTSVSATLSIAPVSQCRVWNKGPNPCRLLYSTAGSPATSADMAFPNSFMEIHDRNGKNWISAICAPGETAVLEITAGQGEP